MPRDLRLGSWILRIDCNRLENSLRSIPLEPKLVELLRYLIGRRGETISKDELFQAVWPNVHVGDEVIWRGISELRRALGDEPRKSRYIQTVARRGYRWIGPSPVEAVQGPSGARPGPSRFAVWRTRSMGPALFATGMLMGFALAPLQSALQPLFQTASLPMVCCADSSDSPQGVSRCPMSSGGDEHPCRAT